MSDKKRNVIEFDNDGIHWHVAPEVDGFKANSKQPDAVIVHGVEFVPKGEGAWPPIVPGGAHGLELLIAIYKNTRKGDSYPYAYNIRGKEVAGWCNSPTVVWQKLVDRVKALAREYGWVGDFSDLEKQYQCTIRKIEKVCDRKARRIKELEAENQNLKELLKQINEVWFIQDKPKPMRDDLCNIIEEILTILPGFIHRGNSITDGDYTIGVDFGTEGITTTLVKRDGDTMHVIDSHTFKKPQPADEWVYAVYNRMEMSGWGDGYVCAVGGRVHAAKGDNVYLNVEEAILDLLKGQVFPQGRRCSGTPIFGVRKLRDGDWGRGWVPNTYGAFCKGKFICDSQSDSPRVCIKWVLDRLTPSTPAVTLADLAVAE